MRCDEARQLLNAHLDGELAGTLAAEFHAHRLQCAECRRQLALLEVTGHLLATPTEAGELRGDFTDRLLACVDDRRKRWLVRVRRATVIGVPLAAAAMIMLAFLGFFDRGRESRVAGLKVVDTGNEVAPAASSSPKDAVVSEFDARAAQRAVDEWLTAMQSNVQRKQQSGQSLQQAFDLTILQVLNVLEEINTPSVPSPMYPGIEGDLATPPIPPVGSDADEDVEDL